MYDSSNGQAITRTMNQGLVVAVMEKGLHVSDIHGHISMIWSFDSKADNCSAAATVVTISVYWKPYY